MKAWSESDDAFFLPSVLTKGQYMARLLLLRTSHGRGYTVIEILVCLVVMSIVVICAAGLSLQTTRMSRHSAQFSAAAALAGELAESWRMQRFRQPRAEADNTGIDVVAGDPPDSTVDCYASSCDPDQMRRFELQDWLARVATILPGARVRVCRDSAPWDAAKRSLGWKCTAAADGDAPWLVKLGWVTPIAAAGDTAQPLLVVPVE